MKICKLPELYAIKWRGPDRGLIEAVRTHWISAVVWRDAEGDLDFTGTRLISAEFGGAGLRSVDLPQSMDSLRLLDPSPRLRVGAPGLAQLQVICERDEEINIPQGLLGVRGLWCRVSRSFSFSVLDGLTGLEELTVILDRAPGTLTDVADLGRHAHLRMLDICDAYDWDPRSLPELPSLRELNIDGVRRDAAAVLRARFKGSGVELSILGAKSDRWLAEHMDNPFRDWVEESRPFGAAACKAYVNAAAAVRAGEVERGLRGLAADLAALQEKYGLIDTMLREEAWDVFVNLADGTGVTEEQLEAWFDGRAA